MWWSTSWQTSNNFQEFAVTFAVTPADTGTIIINNQTFQQFPFQAVGFDLSNLPTGTNLILYNPLITDPTTRALCENYTIPQLVEPLTRLLSTVPYRRCIFNEEIQLDFPGQDIGTCGCDVSTGGEVCDCIAVDSKYGKEVCGGFGDPDSYLQGADGQFYRTKNGESAGCYIINGYSDCKTIDIGTLLFTSLVPGAIWNFPSVFPDSPPSNNAPLFIEITNSTQNVIFQDATITWEITGSRLAYFLTGNELNQLVVTADLPIFISTLNTSTYQWKWTISSPGTDYFFINDQPLSAPSSPIIGDYSCLLEPEFCEAINFNNWITLNTSNCMIDGNSIDPCPAPTVGDQIIFDSLAPLEQTIYIFNGPLATIDCFQGGVCQNRQTFGNDVTYSCRCSNRIIQFISANPLAEIQIFSKTDLIRTTLYNYLD
jgi:hypothetical protein